MGSVGIVGLTLGRGLTPSRTATDPDQYTRYTYAATTEPGDGPRIRVAWNSTYNGEPIAGDSNETNGDSGDSETPVESNDTSRNGSDSSTTSEPALDGYDPSVSGPLINESNVLPGDSGTTAVGLYPEEMDARVRLFVTDGSGDGPVSGALAEAIDVALWYDIGFFGIGGCQGTESVPDDPAVETTLRDLGDRYGPDGDGFAIKNGVGDCLEEGEHICLGFAWRIDESITNAYQGTSASFGLQFRAEQCGGEL